MNQRVQTVNQEALQAKKTKKYTGEVVYIFAFDIAYELQVSKIKKLFEQPIAEFGLDISKRSPKQLLLHRSYMVRLPPVERIGPDGLVHISRNVKLFQVGAISITIRVPFEVDHFSELVRYHDIEFKSGTLYDEVKELANQILEELKPYSVRPINQIGDEEAYTVFCINSPVLDLQMEKVNTEIWFKSHRRQIASLLTQETDQSILSKQESDESTERYLTYYENDLVVIDWDAALIIDEQKDFDEVLYIMELANLHLAELEAYDKILDQAIDIAYKDLYVHAIFRHGNIMRDLREIKVDMARISDELLNITKFFGDWHLARIYEIIASRFHLPDWYRIIDEKLKTLGEIYQMLYQDKLNQWMLILETTIVLLFIIDLIVLIIGLPPSH